MFNPAQRPLGLVFALFLILIFFSVTATHAAPLTVTKLQTISETRIDRTHFQYVMRGDLVNTGPLARGTAATCASTSPKTVVTENTLTFGNVAAGLTAASADTFTIMHDRTVPFDAVVLQWTIVKVPSDPTVSAPPSPTMLTSTTVFGTTDPNASIEIGGGPAPANATGAFTASVPLSSNRLNALFVTAFNTAGRSAPVPVAVLQDAQPSSLFIDFPADNAELTNASIVVGERIGEMLSGFLGLSVTLNSEPSTLNSFAANVNVSIGNNGTFERSAVPLVVGNNTLTAIATYVNGNTVSKQITVKRIVPTGPQMLQISGDMQTAPIHARLPQPIVVKIVNGDGTPSPARSSPSTSPAAMAASPPTPRRPRRAPCSCKSPPARRASPAPGGTSEPTPAAPTTASAS